MWKCGHYRIFEVTEPLWDVTWSANREESKSKHKTDRTLLSSMEIKQQFGYTFIKINFFCPSSDFFWVGILALSISRITYWVERATYNREANHNLDFQHYLHPLCIIINTVCLIRRSCWLTYRPRDRLRSLSPNFSSAKI